MSGDPLDLDAIEARARAATPGPWESDGLNGQVCSPSGLVVDGIEMWAETDAEFIAHARDDVPALVAEVRRCQGALDRRAWSVRRAEYQRRRAESAAKWEATREQAQR